MAFMDFFGGGGGGSFGAGAGQGLASGMVATGAAPEQAGFFGQLGQRAGAAGQQFGQMAREDPNRLAIILDALGTGIDPQNPLAGIATQLAQSDIAAQEAGRGQEQAQGQLQQLIGALTPGDQPGPTSFQAQAGKNGGIDFMLKGATGAPGTAPGTQTPTAPAPTQAPPAGGVAGLEDFVRDFG